MPTEIYKTPLLLEWDSHFFGFPVGRLSEDIKSQTQLLNALEEAKSRGFRLLYFEIPANNIWEPNLQNLGGTKGLYVDTKILFTGKLEERDEILPPSVKTEPYCGTDASQLEILALGAGEHSRFRVDPNISAKKFEELYTTWIRRSITGDIADLVLVSSAADNGITGLVTFKVQSDRGKIGLISITPMLRGQGIGKTLLRAAEHQMLIRGARYIEVITQAENVAAAKLYRSLGYVVTEQKKRYHFWL